MTDDQFVVDVGSNTPETLAAGEVRARISAPEDSPIWDVITPRFTVERGGVTLERAEAVAKSRPAREPWGIHSICGAAACIDCFAEFVVCGMTSPCRRGELHTFHKDGYFYHWITAEDGRVIESWREPI